MKLVSLLVLLCIFLSFAGISGKIKGYVKDENGDPLLGAHIVLDGTTFGAESDEDGYYYIIGVRAGEYTIRCTYVGYFTVVVPVAVKSDLTVTIDITMYRETSELDELQFMGTNEAKADQSKTTSSRSIDLSQVQVNSASKKQAGIKTEVYDELHYRGGRTGEIPAQGFNTEEYANHEENTVKETNTTPVSTFSIDVDNASYSNIRRFISNNQKPDIGSVRIEEMINYFDYNYESPKDDKPFAVHTEMSDCPWNVENKLVSIGLKGQVYSRDKLPVSNLVFLLDVSGSMSDPNKLPLLKKSFRNLVENLSENDIVSIVVYAGAAGVVLEPTTGDKKEKILSKLEQLQAGGSTAGGAGIQLAYKLAQEHLIKHGNNRIILATDGDFNVGISSTSEMEKLITEKRDEGIFLTVLGFGMGNYKDNRLETLADKGNGNYFYIDNEKESRKVFQADLLGNMFTIAKDVKIQIEFNPQTVESYRLVGYENRILNKEDFNDDTKDAGELGAGHKVTALYEVKLG